MLDLDSSYVPLFNDIRSRFELIQMVTEPTSISNTNSTLFNLIYCNPDMMKGVGVRVL